MKALIISDVLVTTQGYLGRVFFSILFLDFETSFQFATCVALSALLQHLIQLLLTGQNHF